MQIEKLIIVGLYGYINKEIDFNSDLTLLVGINGSGKTSILNIINWIIKPSRCVALESNLHILRKHG